VPVGAAAVRRRIDDLELLPPRHSIRECLGL
jgi:hypothetical protein